MTDIKMADVVANSFNELGVFMDEDLEPQQENFLRGHVDTIKVDHDRLTAELASATAENERLRSTSKAASDLQRMNIKMTNEINRSAAILEQLAPHVSVPDVELDALAHDMRKALSGEGE